MEGFLAERITAVAIELRSALGSLAEQALGGGIRPSKLVTRLGPGDRVLVETTGGGGYGAAARRATERGEADRVDGKVA